MAFAFALALHAHQPAGNFDAVLEQTYRTSYLPFLQAASRRPWLRLNLHFSGFLLDWLAERHPEYLDLLRQLLASGRLELLGGGYYEPILAVIPASHQRAQLDLLRAALERHFGLRPRGAWLAERVWEPQVASLLARAGIEFTILDDTHFELAGIPTSDLHGYWRTEDQGAGLAIVPSNFFLRQALPFRPVAESLPYLRAAAAAHPGSLLTMGDDLEKFGSWPHTFEHVYRGGWLEQFFDALELHAAEIETVLLSSHLDRNPARGLRYVPTASYPEMMQWAGSSTWRGFLAKYPEANLLHKTLWDLHRRFEAAGLAPGADLLAAETNDVFWHGWFGGLYSPHLRNLAFTHLLAADAAVSAAALPPPLRRFNLLGDGAEIVELRSDSLRCLLAPALGGTLIELDWLPGNANIINSIQRKPEPYHEDLRRHAESNPAQLPGPMAAPDAALQELLVYDRFPPHAGRLYCCPPGKSFRDYLAGSLDPDLDLAAGRYTVDCVSPARVFLDRSGVRKEVAIAGDSCTCSVELTAASDRQPMLECVANLLAPGAPDRGLEHGGARRRLDWQGELGPGPLELFDGWRGFRIALAAPAATAWWVRPLRTVSQAESGFEAVYQGSAIMAVWPPGTRRLRLEIKIFRDPSHF
ncbi:MAG TPA: alpha-amylase/4-alpha-glucanotransferase domain-containing protein [Terriglobales bacterium]|nr:alpha-amylase/4-alpha-glucanotransferase domain-containing protein [Terriglobales bacterium]